MPRLAERRCRGMALKEPPRMIRRAIADGPGRAVQRRPVIPVVVTIIGPRPDIADHVIKTKAIGGE